MNDRERIALLEDFLENGIVRDKQGNLYGYVAPIYEALHPVLNTYKSIVADHENSKLKEQ